MSKKSFNKLKEKLNSNKNIEMSERQMIDKAVQDIHTDKKQIDEVLNELPSDLQEKVLKELERRGDDLYPERGPDDE